MPAGLTQEVFTASISGTPTLNSPTSFDGKNAWFTTGTASHVIHIIEFWGPYLEDTGEMTNATHPRWAEIAVDQITMGAMGPKVREIHTMTPGAKVLQFVRNELDVTTAICEGDLRIRYSEITYQELSRTTVHKPDPPAPPSIWSLRSGSCIWMVKSTDKRHYQETPWHYFTVSSAPEDQCGADTQELQWWHRDTGAFLGTTQIPGRKQQADRYIAYLQGKIYLSAFNEGGLFVFDAETGAYLTKISINRDTEEMFVYGNFIYVSSRNGLFTRVDQNYGVTDLGGIATRNYYVNLLDTTPVALSNWDFWGISRDCINRFDGGSTVWEIESKANPTVSNVPPLSPSQIRSLTTTQVAALTVDEIKSFTPSNIVLLTGSQFAALTPTQIANFSPLAIGNLTGSQIGSMTTLQVASLSANQIIALTPSNIDSFSESQLQNMQVDKIEPIDIKELSATHLQALTTDQVSTLSVNQISALSTIPPLKQDDAKITKLTADQFKKLTNEQIKTIPPSVLAKVPAANIAALSNTQLGQITQSQANSLTGTQLSELSNAQLSALPFTSPIFAPIEDSYATYFRKDNRLGKKFKLYGDYKSVVFMPEKIYQYWTGTSMTTVTVPAHLLFSGANTIKAVRFPGIYRGETDKSYGGVMAISTGPLRYKGDAI